MQQKLMAIAFLLASLGHAEIAFLAFSDNECTEPLTMESPEFFDGQPLNGLPITASITDVERANGKWYDDVSFPGATTSSSTGTQKKVYWQAPRPDRECAFLLMKAFDRSMDHTTISKLNGEIIINARKQGCYYSSLDVSFHEISLDEDILTPSRITLR
jgi:hypothetical protein